MPKKIIRGKPPKKKKSNISPAQINPSRTSLYKLQGKTPVPCHSPEDWGHAFRNNRRVSETQIKNYRISTVFLGIDHQFGDGPPLLFETMIFKDSRSLYCNRYSTWKQAEQGHKETVLAVRARKLP